MRQNLSIFHYSSFFFCFLLTGSIVLSVFISSCSSSVKNPLLLRADSLMETRPDSSLSILESITFPQKLSRSDKAYYALLLTQARHKNYIPLKNDSLIKIAVDYYGDTKRNLNAVKAHYYLGATYRDMERTSFAVEEYLKAIQLASEENEFVAMVYENLAECYEDENLYDIAMEAYRKACHIRKAGTKQIFSLRGIGYVFLLQNQLDSALHYYQKAMDYALAEKDSNWISGLNHDFAIAYEQKGDHLEANRRISQAIEMADSVRKANLFWTKGQIMLNLNLPDSAWFYFNEYKDDSNIYGKAICYDGLYQTEKDRGNWKTAVETADIYMALYDSIQHLSDSKELARLMDNYQLEEYKKELSQHTRKIVIVLTVLFFILVVVTGFLFLWKDRKRKNHYIALQKKLTEKRVDLMRATDAIDFKEGANDKLVKLKEEQWQLCVSIFQTKEAYKKLLLLEKATPKQLLSLRPLVPFINETIRNDFIDIMADLKGKSPSLTSDDLFYCILSLLHCSKNTIMELMDVSSDAIKTRKNRIKNKVDPKLFEDIFNSGNCNKGVFLI